MIALTSVRIGKGSQTKMRNMRRKQQMRYNHQLFFVAAVAAALTLAVVKVRRELISWICR